jgi:hypothetical protein
MIGQAVHRLVAREQDIIDQMDRFARKYHDKRSGAMTCVAGRTQRVGVAHCPEQYRGWAFR